MTEVSIVQPYVPRYRIPFFDQLAAALSRDGITLRVIAGQASHEQRARGDSATAPWMEAVESRVIRVRSRHLSLTNSRSLWLRSDAVIVPHQGTSFDALTAIGLSPRLPVGVWGHIAPYTSPLNPLDGRVERWQLRRARHVFAYMPGGAQFARERGVPDAKITTVMNTIDTSALTQALEESTPDDTTRFLERSGAPRRPYVAYIGGLDASKRIEFLAESLELLHQRRSDAHVVVAGQGTDQHLLAPAVARGQATLVGYVGVREKAAVLNGASAVLNPGRVGLVAVDCLVARRPLITTDWPWHAPEIEYLTVGDSVILTPDNAAAFADAIQRSVHDPGLERTLHWPRPPTMDAMVANFYAGTIALLNS
ncbi:glycosyltransferase family 4 protein [Microbacterium hominis]|uniref:Glycosyltransferase subfamily 4-like N-terminal domain-containing protein n=1 Tax=Microbacterium hominis TaxID=162426 RepID=A0A0B4CDR0_9MICO|nr:glycosyltransferase family 4 protein [Microbacterium hominis]KIC59374.1 hypothetical protein RM52_04025 [Microbacterium hominis]